MPKTKEPLNVKLYDKLKTLLFEPVAINDGKPAADAENATAFNFTFKRKNKKVGTFIIAINNLNELIIFFNKNAVKNAVTEWTDFLKDMSNWATRHGLRYDTDPGSFNDWMKRQKKHSISEGYHGTKYTSTSDSTPAQVKMFIRHNKALEENDQRFRHVDKIFVENQFGERFVLPTKKPSEGYVFARLIAEGGNPYDERGKHIAQLCDDIKKLGGFIRATHKKQFNESVNVLITEAAEHYLNLRETMKKLRSSRGFRQYFENWTPTLREVQPSEGMVAEMFTHQHLDPRIEAAIPVLENLGLAVGAVGRVAGAVASGVARGAVSGAVSGLTGGSNSSSTSSNNSSIVADMNPASVEEDLEPTQTGDIDALVELLSNDSEELFLGPDATNAIGQIKDYIDDDTLFNRLENAAGDPNADAKTIIIAWMREQPDNQNFSKVLDKLDDLDKEGLDTPAKPEPTAKPNTEKSKPSSNNKSSAQSKEIAQQPPRDLDSMPSAPPLAENELARIRKLSGLLKRY